MKCPKCQRDNRDDAKFCDECGHPLKTPAPSSPIDFNKPHSYTPKFLADKILTTRSAMEGERKRVTVLFADVAGFTSMSEKLDPEKVHQIMDGCFKTLMDEIHNHQGTINQFTGDGVMALFGAPVAIENHAQNACQAALSIQSAIKKYSEDLKTKFGLDFKMRIGLNTGPVIVGSIGDDLRMDYTAIGDTVNLASRMESNAEPGNVLVSPNTYERVMHRFKFKPLGKVAVKGKEEPLDVYELVGQIEKSGAGLNRQIFSEMVGRDDDLNKLELQVNKAASGEGSIVNVIGEAGIGKSRLIAELRNSSVMKRVTLLEGRAISIGRNLSFHPIINLLKHWAQINAKDTSVSALGKLETAIRSVCPEDTNEIFPFVATLMGMKLSGRYAERVNGIEGEALEKLIFKNLRDLLIKTTEQTPLVVVIEDLHWADTSSIELLESMFRLAETQRIVFINAFRPNHPETGDRIIETIKEKLSVYYVGIKLQPLNEQMGEMLIHNMLKIKGLQQAVIDQIIQRAGGNPFFIEEVVRSFIDTGAVVIVFSGRHSTELYQQIFFSWKAEAQILLNDIEGAQKSLFQAKRIIDQHKFLAPIFMISYCIAQFMMDIYSLKETIISNKDRKNLSKLKKMAHQSGKRALNNSKKFALNCVKTLRLMGEYYWLIGKQKKAIKWWDRAIKKGEALGARPDLSRTYFEVGKRLMEPASKYKELNGITAEEYLNKAKTLFIEMDLQWDLDELDEVMAAGR